MKKLFTNSVLVKAQSNEVKRILLDSMSLIKWNPAITEITKIDDKTFSIHRDVEALNRDEVISISEAKNQIIYSSTGGRLEYQLMFSLIGEDKFTVIKEVFYMSDETKLPMVLLKPIAKNAFNSNLIQLKEIIEQLN